MSALGRLVEDERTNALLAWLVVAVLVVVVVESALAGGLLWAGLAAVVVALAVVPAAVTGRPTANLPWELLVLAALPLAGRTFGVVTQVATYLAVTAVALVVAVELHAFTDVEMTPAFAVVFVVLTTMAVAGAWASVQWLSDRLLATDYLSTRTALMWDLTVASATGVLGGVAYAAYFRERGARGLGEVARGERP